MVYIQSNIGVICFNTLFPPGGFCLCFWQKSGSALIGTAVAPFEGPVSLMGSQVQFLKLAMGWELGPGGHRALQTPLWNCVSSLAPCTGLLELVAYRSGFVSLFFCHFSSSLLLSLLPFLKLVSFCPPKSRNVLRIALAVTDLRPGCPATGRPIETVVLHLRPTEDVLVPSPHAQKF